MAIFKNVVTECCECGKQDVVKTEGFTYHQIQPSSLRWVGKCHICGKHTKHKFLGLKGEENQSEKVIFT